MGRIPEYDVKKVRVVGWCHPKTEKRLKALAKKRKCAVGKILDEAVKDGVL